MGFQAYAFNLKNNTMSHHSVAPEIFSQIEAIREFSDDASHDDFTIRSWETDRVVNAGGVLAPTLSVPAQRRRPSGNVGKGVEKTLAAAKKLSRLRSVPQASPWVGVNRKVSGIRAPRRRVSGRSWRRFSLCVVERT